MNIPLRDKPIFQCMGCLRVFDNPPITYPGVSVERTFAGETILIHWKDGFDGECGLIVRRKESDFGTA